MLFSPLVDDLINALRCLPGIGPKSAQRMAFHLLERGQQQAVRLADCLQEATSKIKHCQKCNTFSETDCCHLCAHPRRDQSLLCIVESPIDMLAIEQTNSYRGLYFVLMGHLSPIDGIGPKELKLDLLYKRLAAENINEVILATNLTVEGETTAHYIADMVKRFNIRTSRIAQGIPLGSELELVDSGTLARALEDREILV